MGTGYNPASRTAKPATVVAAETSSYAPSAPVAPAPSGGKTYQVNSKTCTLHPPTPHTEHQNPKPDALHSILHA